MSRLTLEGLTTLAAIGAITALAVWAADAETGITAIGAITATAGAWYRRRRRRKDPSCLDSRSDSRNS